MSDWIKVFISIVVVMGLAALGWQLLYDRTLVEAGYEGQVGSAELPRYRLIHQENFLRDAISQVSWSADSSRLARISDRQQFVYELDGRAVDKIYKARRRLFSGSMSTVLHPNGQWLFEKTGLNDWRLFDFETDATIYQETNEWFSFEHVKINPAGDRLLVHYRENLILYDTADWSVVWRQKGAPFFRDVFFSPDNRTLIIVDDVPMERSVIEVWDYRRFEQVIKFDISNTLMWSSALSPDGTLLATGADRRFFLKPDHENYVPEPDSLIQFSHVAPGPDLGTQYGIIPTTADDYRFVNALTFSANGRVLAAAIDDWHIDLFDVAGLRQYARLPMPDTYIFDLKFSPDGQYLAAAGQRSLFVWQREVTH